MFLLILSTARYNWREKKMLLIKHVPLNHITEKILSTSISYFQRKFHCFCRTISSLFRSFVSVAEFNRKKSAYANEAKKYKQRIAYSQHAAQLN